VETFSEDMGLQQWVTHLLPPQEHKRTSLVLVEFFAWLDSRAFLPPQFEALGHSLLRTQMQCTWFLLKCKESHFPLFAGSFLEVKQEEGGTKSLA